MKGQIISGKIEGKNLVITINYSEISFNGNSSIMKFQGYYTVDSKLNGNFEKEYIGGVGDNIMFNLNCLFRDIAETI